MRRRDYDMIADALDRANRRIVTPGDTQAVWVLSALTADLANQFGLSSRRFDRRRFLGRAHRLVLDEVTR